MMGNMMAHGGVFLGNSMPMPPGLPLHPFVGNYPPMGSTGYAVAGSDGYGSVEPDTDSDESETNSCRSLSETKPLHLQEKVKEAEEQLRVAKKRAKDAEKDELEKASEAAERAAAAEQKHVKKRSQNTQSWFANNNVRGIRQRRVIWKRTKHGRPRKTREKRSRRWSCSHEDRTQDVPCHLHRTPLF